MLSTNINNLKCFNPFSVILIFLFIAISPRTNAQIYGQTMGSAFKGVNWAAVDDNFNKQLIFVWYRYEL